MSFIVAVSIPRWDKPGESICAETALSLDDEKDGLVLNPERAAIRRQLQ